MTKALTVQEKNTALVGLLDSHKSQIQAALPKHVPVDLLIRSVLTQLRTTPKLLECTQSSVYLCVMHMAELGLRCGPERLAYLIPFRNSKKDVTECQLMIGYPGWLKLIRQSGEISAVVVRAVYEEDYLEVEYGLEEKLVHRPCITGTREKLVGVYAVAQYRHSGVRVFDFMTLAEVEERRKASKGADSDAWRLWYDEMAKKTVLLRLRKILPTSTEDHGIAAAAEWDGRAEAGKPQHLPSLGGSDALEAQDAPILIDADPPVEEPKKAASKPRQPRKPAQKADEDTGQRAKDLATVRGYLIDGRVELEMVRSHAFEFGHKGDLEQAPADVLAKLVKTYANWEKPKQPADGPGWAQEQGE